MTLDTEKDQHHTMSDSPDEAAPKYKRLTINVAPELHAQLQDMAAERGITVTELLRRAVAIEKFLYEHRDEKLLLKDGNETREIVLV